MGIPAEVANLFSSYPKVAQDKLYAIRELIFAVAKEQNLGKISESLKWGEASYTCAKGSPIRIDWKAKQAQSISIYVNCKTSLIETISARIRLASTTGERLHLIGSREIRFPLNETLPQEEIKFCLSLALRYHRIKHLPSLGA